MQTLANDLKAFARTSTNSAVGDALGFFLAVSVVLIPESEAPPSAGQASQLSQAPAGPPGASAVVVPLVHSRRKKARPLRRDNRRDSPEVEFPTFGRETRKSRGEQPRRGAALTRPEGWYQSPPRSRGELPPSWRIQVPSVFEKKMLSTPDNLQSPRLLVHKPALPTKTSEILVPEHKRWRWVVTLLPFVILTFSCSGTTESCRMFPTSSLRTTAIARGTSGEKSSGDSVFMKY